MLTCSKSYKKHLLANEKMTFEHLSSSVQMTVSQLGRRLIRRAHSHEDRLRYMLSMSMWRRQNLGVG